MKVFIPVLIIFIVALAIYLSKHKKNPKMGGAMALSKKLWLAYTIWTWFFLLPLVLIFDINSTLYFLSWLGFTSLMWIRGILELYMLYVTKNWVPPIGIAHDLICVIWLLVTTPFQTLFLWSSDSFFHLSLIISIIAETYYAYGFYKIVGRKTKGDEPIWFANKENPAFKKILVVTTIVNWIVIPSMIIFCLNRF